MLEYSRSEARIFFWRTSSGAEVDLVVEKHGRLITACEIKSSPVIDSRDFSGLKSFMDDNPGVPCYLAAITNAPYEKDGVRVVPWEMFIEEVTAKI